MTDKELIEILGNALAEARDNMADWGAYASYYIQWKWDLAGDLATCDNAIAAWRQHEPFDVLDK